jgi:hypothetical protein
MDSFHSNGAKKIGNFQQAEEQSFFQQGKAIKDTSAFNKSSSIEMFYGYVHEATMR